MLEPGGSQDSWNNGAGGTFSTSGNWTPPGPPTTGDRATFGLTGGYTVDFAATANSDYLVVTSGNTVTFDLGGNTYNVNSGPAVPTSTTYIGSNASDNVKLIVTDGTLNLQNNTSYKYALLAPNGSTATLEVNSSVAAAEEEASSPITTWTWAAVAR